MINDILIYSQDKDDARGDRDRGYNRGGGGYDRDRDRYGGGNYRDRDNGRDHIGNYDRGSGGGYRDRDNERRFRLVFYDSNTYSTIVLYQIGIWN